MEFDQEKLAEFSKNLDWLNNGTHGYHLPRHALLYSKTDYLQADQSQLPIKIAKYIFELDLN